MAKAKSKTMYVCQECGYDTPKWLGRCPGCGAWNTMVEEVIKKDDGERVILTFGGEKPFILIEETVGISDELEIIPTLGEPTLLTDTVGALSEDSVSWISKGMQYYITSENLSQDELVSVAKSISTIPVMK